VREGFRGHVPRRLALQPIVADRALSSTPPAQASSASDLRAGAVLFDRNTRSVRRAGIRVGLAVATTNGVIVCGASLRAYLAGPWLVRGAAPGLSGVLAKKTGRARTMPWRATGCANGSGCCLCARLAKAPMTNRCAVRVRHAIVAVVSAVAAAHRSPLLRAHGGLPRAFARSGDLAAVLRFAVLAKEAIRAHGRRSAGPAASGGRIRCRCTLARVPRRNTM
jgi:hypothetical protein